MNSSLKTRLIFAFSSIILIPILALLITFYIGAVNLEIQDNPQLDRLFTDVEKAIHDHEDILYDGKLFYQKIEPLLEQYDISMRIQSQDNILFDSKEFGSYKENHFQFLNLNDFQIRSTTNEVWSVDIQANSFQMEPFRSLKDILNILILSIVVGLGTLIILIVLWTWYITRTVLYPLKDIYIATEEMREGNLDYAISYKRRDEIGRFIQGFNLMRKHLKDSFIKQQLYEESRKELIAIISHDLRTPLSSIKGYVEGLQDGIVQTEEMRMRYLNVIHDKTEHLDRLIEDLFEFSKMDLEQLTIEKQLVNAADFFSTLLGKFQFDIMNKDIELTYTKLVVPVSILLDETRINQVMNNLIYNAIQYGASSIQVQVVVEKYSLVIKVKDKGQGIDPKDLPYVFNQFYRGEKSRSTKYGGSGLGLSIVKYIVNAHNGIIEVQSKKGKGSTFILSLPLFINGKVDE